jgi:DNA recombination protein RmuC
MDKMGRKINDAQQEFHLLTSTRRRALERPLNEIESLRRHRGIPPSSYTENKHEEPSTDV